MNLTIDAGNTAVKMMVFDDGIPVFRITSEKPGITILKKILDTFPITHSILSTVINIPVSLIRLLEKKSELIILDHRTRIPLKNRYRTKETLGRDRLAGVVAANFLFPGSDVLVVDIGTCIKYDFVNRKNEYLGGSISPGLEMRFKALHSFTARLPLVKPGRIRNETGNSTETSILTGVMVGMREEITGFINLYRRKYPSLKVVVSGGDAGRFAGQLKLSIFAAPDLVNLGLNEIIRYNVKK